MSEISIADFYSRIERGKNKGRRVSYDSYRAQHHCELCEEYKQKLARQKFKMRKTEPGSNSRKKSDAETNSDTLMRWI